MTHSDPSEVTSWHVHVYFDATRRDGAFALRDRIMAALGDMIEMGRFHERPVGPHPQWSYQVAFTPDRLTAVLTWLTLNRDGFDVFMHPNTGDSLRDHRDRAVWIGRSYALNLGVFGN
ncbi:DOPA 4,5-dioxygenase family protein [Alcaligenaceae bacterium B3P038]|nr:DOPA 4,5-dioxygenase family protein [Alcaligenaceae bacterium B3P038]